MFARYMGWPSPVLDASPRTRLVCCLAALACLAQLVRVSSAALALPAALVLLALARPDWRHVLGRLACVNGFTIFLWLTVRWSVPGETAWRLGPLIFSREGLELCLLVTLKTNAMVPVFMALVAGMSPSRLGGALDGLRCPPRLTFLLLLACRYIPVLAEEWRTLRTAASLRGFIPGTNARTWKVFAMLLGMLFVRAHDRSTRIWEAMRLRGFTGRFPVDAARPAGRADLVLCLGLGLCLALLVVRDRFPEVLP